MLRCRHIDGPASAASIQKAASAFGAEAAVEQAAACCSGLVGAGAALTRSEEFCRNRVLILRCGAAPTRSGCAAIQQRGWCSCSEVLITTVILQNHESGAACV